MGSRVKPTTAYLITLHMYTLVAPNFGRGFPPKAFIRVIIKCAAFREWATKSLTNGTTRGPFAECLTFSRRIHFPKRSTPRSTKGAKAKLQSSAIITPMKKIRTLLADDHEVVRAGIRNALTSLELLEIVGEVADGPGVLEMLRATTPDLLLIDVTMPNFDPIKQIRAIHAQYPTMKILVVSAYDDDVYVQGLLGAGVDGYHLKDQPLSDLRLAVQRVLAGERWVSSRLVNQLLNLNSGTSRSAQAGGQAEGGQLTARQSEIMRLLQDGLDNNSIARRMNLSVKTIENHLTRLYRQLNVQSRLEAVNYVMQNPQVLDIRAQRQQEKSTSAPLPTIEGQISVLLIDDNTRYRHQLRRMVGKACDHANIYEADSIQRAAELAEQMLPKLVLIDVVLGDEDGIRCTRRVKALSPASRIVLITAYPDREFHRRGLEAGAVALLDKKDLDTPALRQVIEDSI